MRRDTNHFADQLPPNLKPILHHAVARFQLGEMSIHGPIHWLKAFQNATILADRTPGADREVCQLFALLHDCERRNENFDPQHGPRAARFAEELFQQGKLAITQAQMAILCEACTSHDRGETSPDPTIGCCWDADRLDLPRLGIRVSREYLSTATAMEMI